MTTTQLPLAGIKVVELTRLIVGPAFSRFLATCGATVVHVETRNKLDYMRIFVPYKDNVSGINRAAYFNSYNVDKYGMTLDLKRPKGLELMRRLIRWADLFIESNAPRALDQYDLNYAGVSELNPNIIMISSTQMGQTGPWSSYKGYGMQAAAMAGFHSVTGYADSGPVGPFGAYTDVVSAHCLMSVALAALDFRKRTGKGQYIDHSQVESGVHFSAPAILEYTANGKLPDRVGNREESMAPHGCYRCRGDERWCAIAIRSDEEWAILREVMGNPKWAGEPRFATLLGRKQHEDDLDRLVENWTAQHLAEEVVARLREAGIPTGILSKARDLNEDPQLIHRGHYKVLPHSELGDTPFTNPPFKLSKTPCEVHQAAPCMGEHTDWVCREILGLTDEEFVELLNEGVFE